MRNSSAFLREEVFRQRTRRTLHWLQQNIEQGGDGSAAYYHLWRGWAAPYPETTGYIIETLFDYGDYFQEEQWRNLATRCADWLCSIQLANGAFPGGVGIEGEPLIFDTGQIIFGLTRTFVETGEEKYRLAFEKAVHWLLELLKPDGSWRQYAYVPGYTPSYYTRVVWAVLNANQVLRQAGIDQQMQQALDFYLQKITPNQSIQDWAFAPGEAAFTHTIAYTLRGMLESALLLEQSDLLAQPLHVLDKIVKLHQQRGKLAGCYDAHWQGDYTFSCVTGDAQMSILLARAYQTTGDQIYLEVATQVFERVAGRQWTFPFHGLRGAIPGSAPVWGAYQRFRFPNWAAKFYLDMYLILEKLEPTH